MLKFSFIIPTLGKRENILNILEKIETSLNREYEIIVVYDGNMSKILVHAGEHQKIRLLRGGSENIGAAFKRNLGASASNYDFLIFMDDDVMPDDTFFNFLDNIEDLNEILIPEIKTQIRLPFPLGDHVSGKVPVTACMVIPKSLFYTIGSFNNEFLNYRDDTEFFTRARKLGIRMEFIDGAFVNHPVRFTKFITFRSFFMKNTVEPLFHKLTNGDYAGILQSGFLSSIPNRYGLSFSSYFLFFWLILFVGSYTFGLILPFFILLLSFTIVVAVAVSIWNFYGEKLFSGRSSRFFQIVLYLAYICVTIPARIIGSIKYRHFTI